MSIKMSVLHAAARDKEIPCRSMDEVIYEYIVSEQERKCDASVKYQSYEDLQRSMGDIKAPVEDDLEDIWLEVKPRTPEEEEAMREYVDTQKKSKFLFDGKNLIKIKPRKMFAIKALLGKAYLKLREKKGKGSKLKKLCEIEEELTPDFDGFLADFQSPTRIIPLLVETVCDRILMEDRPARGIFVRPADMDVVQQLKLDFKRGAIPENIGCVDDHVLANTLVSFLKDLKSPIIPIHLRDVFVEAGAIKCTKERDRALRECVLLLPDINRLTLGKIVETLEWISGQRNPLILYAKIFAPIIIGYSDCDEEVRSQEFPDMVDTMMGLLSMDVRFYEFETLDYC